MASAFSHAIASIALGRGLQFKESVKFWILGIFCAVIPDADVLAFRFGIPYGNPFGHRGCTHSIFFAFFLALLVVAVFYKTEWKNTSRRTWLFSYFFLATVSHGILDAFTNGGLGVAFFFPFDNSRYFFPWRPIQVSPINVSSFFTHRGLTILKSEFIWIWIPSFLVIIVSAFAGKRRKNPGK